MNCAECQEQLVPYIEQLLDEAQAEQVARHLQECPSCQAELEGLQTLQARLVSNGKAVAQSDLEEDVMNRIIREQSVRLKSATQASASLRLRRLIMNNPTTRVAAAAAVIVACVAGMMLWQGTESIALADVLAKVEQIQAYMFKSTTTMEDPTMGTSTTESTVLLSNDYGMRVDQSSVDAETGEESQVEMYVLPQEKAIVMLHLSEKQYARVTLDDATLENSKIENRDPRAMLKHLLACEYRDLGRSVVDGYQVQGFETTDPKFLGGIARNHRMTLWVDVDTWLPVRSETETEVSEGIRATGAEYDFQWGVAVHASQFEPDIPDDFTPHQMNNFRQPSYSEQGFIEALQLAVEFTGHYPDGLSHDSLRSLTMEITQAITTGDSPAAQQWREQIKAAGSKEAAIRMGQERMMKLTSLTMFNLLLAGQQKDPVYHGDVVTPADVELPLMRWKAADGQYRVIFGDLHAETVSADLLAELEAALPQ
ncbi:MAG: zf-HC2 domain-containing protein [Phycisphaerales bacterium]|nr:MAG: zf-HC2 domain-containing protein [Phycisphaerales bacterium]